VVKVNFREIWTNTDFEDAIKIDLNKWACQSCSFTTWTKTFEYSMGIRMPWPDLTRKKFETTLSICLSMSLESEKII